MTGPTSELLSPMIESIKAREKAMVRVHMGGLWKKQNGLASRLFMEPSDTGEGCIEALDFAYFMSIITCEDMPAILNDIATQAEVFNRPSCTQSRNRVLELLCRAPDIFSDQWSHEVKARAGFQIASIMSHSELSSRELARQYHALIEKWCALDGISPNSARLEASYKEALLSSRGLSTPDEVRTWLKLENIISNMGRYKPGKSVDSVTHIGLLMKLLSVSPSVAKPGLAEAALPIRERLERRLGQYIDRFVPLMTKPSHIALRAFGSISSASGRIELSGRLARFVELLCQCKSQPEKIKSLIELLLINIANGNQSNMLLLDRQSCFENAKHLINWSEVVIRLTPAGKRSLRDSFQDHSYYSDYLTKRDLRDLLEDVIGL